MMPALPPSDPAQPAPAASIPDAKWDALVALKARWQTESDPGHRAEIRDEYYRLHQDYIVARRKARYPELTGYRPIPTTETPAGPDYDVTNLLDEDGVQHWSKD